MATGTVQDKVIVTTGTAAAGGTTVYHRDFAEIRSEGANPEDAANHLANQLTRALDSALTTWRRDAVQHAIDDVKAFASHPS